MKYVNIWMVSTVMVAATVTGCAQNASQEHWLTEQSRSATLVSTDAHLPEPSRGEEGEWLTYEASANPYENQRGRVNRAAVERFIEARRAIDAEQLNRAKTLLTELTEAEPSLSGPQVLLGDIALAQDDLPGAQAHYAQAIRINEENVNAYLRLAYVQRRQGQFLQAQNTYARSLALWPDFPEAHLNLAVLYDLYLNHPIRAQRHMEAYQFLTGGRNDQVGQWLTEIRSRTGIPLRYPQPGGEGALSYREGD